MNVKQLESVVSIVENGGFAAAAEALGTTQSAVSARVKELEKHLGIQLFDRSQHRARLTLKGEELLPFARQFIRLAEDVMWRFSDPTAFRGIIRIGAAGLVARTVLPRLLTELRQGYPNVSLRVQVQLAGTLANMLQEGSIDVALTTAPIGGQDVSIQPIGHEEFVWLAGPTLCSPTVVLRPKDIERMPVLGFPRESHHFPVISRWFSENGASYMPVISCNNMDVLASLTATGAGVTVLPRLCFGEFIKRGELHVLQTSPEIPPVEFVAVYRRDTQNSFLANTVATMAARLGDQTRGVSKTSDTEQQG